MNSFGQDEHDGERDGRVPHGLRVLDRVNSGTEAMVTNLMVSLKDLNAEERRRRHVDLTTLETAHRYHDPARARDLTVTAVLPTKNEAANLPWVLRRLEGLVHELIVVDANSTDETREIVRDLWPDARIIGQPRKGKGDALAAGFRAATCDIVVMLDADGSTDPLEIPRFIAALSTGADYVKGSRFASGGGSEDITRLRRAGNRVLTTTVNTLWSSNYTDLCYGFTAFWRRHLDVLLVDCPGFEVETLLSIRAASAGLKVFEVPSMEYERRHGVSNLNARTDGVRVLRTIVAERIRPR
jgi:glycosyltransferase involved in cell wall biosynthesis